jgi:hypothetical protein
MDGLDVWDEVEELLLDEAEAELATGAQGTRPCLVALTGRRPCLVAHLRPCEGADLPQALLELLALTAPLGADRLAFAASGRAWSLDDPIPPVADGVDLRAHVLAITTADAARGRVRSGMSLRTFVPGTAGRGASWGERQALPAPEGWVAEVLASAAAAGAQGVLRTTDVWMAAQAARVRELGHVLGLAPDVERRLDDAARRGGLDDPATLAAVLDLRPRRAPRPSVAPPSAADAGGGRSAARRPAVRAHGTPAALRSRRRRWGA